MSMNLWLLFPGKDGSVCNRKSKKILQEITELAQRESGFDFHRGFRTERPRRILKIGRFAQRETDFLTL